MKRILHSLKSMGRISVFLLLGTGSLSMVQNCGSFKATTLAPQMLSLSSTEMPDTSVLAPSSGVIRMGDRYAIAATLKQIFAPPDGTLSAADTQTKNDIEQTINSFIQSQSTSFGAPCSITKSSSDCAETLNDGMNASMLATSNSPREALKMRACEKVLNSDTAVTWALANAFDSEGLYALKPLDSPLDSKNLRKAIALFYPGREFPESAVNSLRALADESLAMDEQQLDGWRMVLLGLCDSPGWELL